MLTRTFACHNKWQPLRRAAAQRNSTCDRAEPFPDNGADAAYDAIGGEPSFAAVGLNGRPAQTGLRLVQHGPSRRRWSSAPVSQPPRRGASPTPKNPEGLDGRHPSLSFAVDDLDA